MIPYEEQPTETNLFIPMPDVDKDAYDFKSHDIYATIIGMVPTLVEKARHGAKSPYLSSSYRGFLVGAAAVAYDTNPDVPRIATYTAGNYKAKVPEEDRSDHDVHDIPKVCAEMDIALHATGDDFERIGIVVVAATTNRDKIADVTELAGATLEPCQDCVTIMNRSDLIDKHTIIMTIGSGSDIYQSQSFENLNRRYKAHREGKPVPRLPARAYSPYAWEDRQAYYIHERGRKRLKANVYAPDKRRELECRKLALLAMNE